MPVLEIDTLYPSAAMLIVVINGAEKPVFENREVCKFAGTENSEPYLVHLRWSNSFCLPLIFKTHPSGYAALLSQRTDDDD